MGNSGFGYWANTFTRWHTEGLPEQTNDNVIADKYFGFAPMAGVPVNVGLLPPIEERVVEENDRHKTYIDGEGVTYMMMKDGADIAMDHYFHQISQVGDTEPGKKQASSPGDSPPKHENKSERRRA